MQDYDDPGVEAQWCAERRQEVAEYLMHEGLVIGNIAASPAWHVAPYVSVWAVENHANPGTVSWWAISGDLPNDYVASTEADSPRKAVQAIASLWLEASKCMQNGEKHPTFRIGSGEQDEELAPLLESRAELLLEWGQDPELWEEDAG